MTIPSREPSAAELESVLRILMAHQEVRETCAQTQRLIAAITAKIEERKT